MRKFYQTLTLLTVSVIMVACGGGATEENPDLASKKAKLDSLKTIFTDVKSQMDLLEDEIADLDPDLKSNDILVAAMVPGKKPFQHMVQFRGSVKSRKDVMISAETMGAVNAVNVREGDRVSKGQLLVSLDGDILKSSLDEAKTQLELAEVMFERQKKLWDQKIGTEIQYLQAKSNYQSLKSRKETLEAQLDQTRIRAPFSGIIDEVNVKLGEMVQPGMQLMRLVNPSEMHIMADVSEDYLGKFKKGDRVKIEFPNENKTFESKVISVGNVLNQNNRTFNLEVSLPNGGDFQFRPNQVAVLNIADYENKSAVVVPSKVILSGKEGKFVYVIEKSSNDQIARKRPVQVGQSTMANSEITSGLNGQEEVIIAGYREVSDGSAVRTADQTMASN